MDKDNMCRIPIVAHYDVSGERPALVSAEYADISTDAIARFLIGKAGANAIRNGGGQTIYNQPSKKERKGRKQ